MFAKLRNQTVRTPNGEIDKPCFFSSLETRSWPQVGCSRRASLDLGRDPILEDWLLAADLLQRQLATFYTAP